MQPIILFLYICNKYLIFIYLKAKNIFVEV